MCLSLCPAKDFTVGYRQPTVRGRGPLSPRRGDLLELRGSGQMNRPGMSGDSSSWKGWGHVRWFIEEVPAGAA